MLNIWRSAQLQLDASYLNLPGAHTASSSSAHACVRYPPQGKVVAQTKQLARYSVPCCIAHAGRIESLIHVYVHVGFGAHASSGPTSSPQARRAMATALSYALCRPRVLARAHSLRLSSLQPYAPPRRLGDHVRTFASSAPAPAAPASSSSNGSDHADAPTFQEAIFRLQQFWSSRGCVVWLPHNTEVRT